MLLGDQGAGLGGSRWARTIAKRRGGTLPRLHLAAHARLVELVAALVAAEAGAGEAPDLVHAVHDVGDGGLGVCLAELAVSSALGASIEWRLGGRALFEAPSRVVVATADADALLRRAVDAAVAGEIIGTVGGDRLVVGDDLDLGVGDLASAFRQRIPDALGEEPFTAGVKG